MAMMTPLGRSAIVVQRAQSRTIDSYNLAENDTVHVSRDAATDADVRNQVLGPDPWSPDTTT